jgi:hypothetical protein
MESFLSRRRNGTAGRESAKMKMKKQLLMNLPTVCDTNAGEAGEGEDGSELHVVILKAV